MDKTPSAFNLRDGLWITVGGVSTVTHANFFASRVNKRTVNNGHITDCYHLVPRRYFFVTPLLSYAGLLLDGVRRYTDQVR